MSAPLPQAILEIRVTPNASRTQCEGFVDGAYRIRLQAVPEKGKANQALIVFLAKTLGLRKSQVSLLQGETSRRKRVQVEGMDEDAVFAILGTPSAK